MITAHCVLGRKETMKRLKKIYCRAYQLCFRLALPVLPYRTPVRLDSVSQIPSLLQRKGVHSVLLVADGGVRRLGLTEELEQGLAAACISCAVYEQLTPNPTIRDVESARSVYLLGKAQAIIALGGGSTMDCAKVVGARIARPKKSVQKMKGLLRIWKRTPLTIAVPTTAGTGSEVTLAAVITDGEKHHKYPINDFALIPDYAVLDPKLTLGLPPKVTATTGLDALTHAVEAYIGGSTNAFTRGRSIEAVERISRSLTEAVRNGQNMAARRDMLQAAFCAGEAFSRSYVGYVHALAHALGGRYGIAHGYANAVILPVFLREYGASCQKKLAELAKKSGVVPEHFSQAQAAENFIRWIESLNRQFGIPEGFPEIRREDIPQMARFADKESNPLYPVPRLMDAGELEAVYLRLCKTNQEELAHAN